MNEHVVIMALLGDDPRLTMLYHTNNEFRTTVITIARSIPAFFNLLADAAEQAAAFRDRMVRDMMAHPVRPLVMIPDPDEVPPRPRLGKDQVTP